MGYAAVRLERGKNMTTYQAIRFLIENKSVDYQTAKAVAFDGYQNNKIDGLEYDRLIVLAVKYLS